VSFNQIAILPLKSKLLTKKGIIRADKALLNQPVILKPEKRTAMSAIKMVFTYDIQKYKWFAVSQIT